MRTPTSLRRPRMSQVVGPLHRGPLQPESESRVTSARWRTRKRRTLCPPGGKPGPGAPSATRSESLGESSRKQAGAAAPSGTLLALPPPPPPWPGSSRGTALPIPAPSCGQRAGSLCPAVVAPGTCPITWVLTGPPSPAERPRPGAPGGRGLGRARLRAGCACGASAWRDEKFWRLLPTT